jgi:hypothetical protein
MQLPCSSRCGSCCGCCCLLAPQQPAGVADVEQLLQPCQVSCCCCTVSQQLVQVLQASHLASRVGPTRLLGGLWQQHWRQLLLLQLHRWLLVLWQCLLWLLVNVQLLLWYLRACLLPQVLRQLL